MKRSSLHSILVFCLLWFFVFTGTQGQQKKSVLDYFPIRLNDQFTFLPAPSLSYKPETNWSLGMALIGNYSPENQPQDQASSFQLDLAYTLNRQLIADLDHHILVYSGIWLLEGSNSLYHYPEKYYSPGDDSRSESIEYWRLSLDNQIFRYLKADWYAGVVYRFEQIKNLKYQTGGVFDTEKPVGFQGGISQGLGVGIVHDSRGNFLNPKKGGAYLKFSSLFFQAFFGGDFEFERFDLDIRKYFGVGTHSIMAFQIAGTATTPGAPFKMQGLLGGSQIMRGYYRGRYWGLNSLAIQAEWRIPVYKFLGATGFMGTGNVANDLSDLFTQTPLMAYGFGLRILIDKKTQANLRLDFAFGKNSQGMYFGYGEAF